MLAFCAVLWGGPVFAGKSPIAKFPVDAIPVACKFTVARLTQSGSTSGAHRISYTVVRTTGSRAAQATQTRKLSHKPEWRDGVAPFKCGAVRAALWGVPYDALKL